MLSNLKKVIVSFFKSISKNKKLSRYIFFFFISFSFWFLSMLSKTHEITLQIPVKYINHPVGLIVVDFPQNSIEVRVKASGFSIFSFHIFNNKSLILNYEIANSKPSNNGKNLFWIMSSKRKYVADLLGSSMEILDISPDKLSVSFTNQSKKELPVVLNSKIDLKKAYWLSDKIVIKPNTVTLYGDNNILDTLTVISTEELQLINLHNNIEKELYLNIPKGLECRTDFVNIEIKVEKFIEEIFEQKVEIRNLQEGYTLKLFPRTVNVTLRLPQDKYSLLKTDFLRLYIDASEISDHNTLKVICENTPSFVKLERIYPKRLEFLLIKD
tara:strand:+ start:24231 stop:25211 length:981 start_codon:yes stop_codon:yes gene_type:complete